MRGVLEAVAGDDAAAPENMQRVGKLVDLRQIGGDQDDPGALLQQRADQPIDFDLGADVDADGRLVEDEELGAVIEPFADDDFLLVAAGQAGGIGVAGGRLDLQILDLALGVARFARRR